MPKTKAQVALEHEKAEKAKRLIVNRKPNGHYWELQWEGGGRLPKELEGGLFTSPELAEEYAESYMAKRG